MPTPFGPLKLLDSDTAAVEVCLDTEQKHPPKPKVQEGGESSVF